MDTTKNDFLMDGQKKKVIITAVASFVVGFGISWILFSVPVSAPASDNMANETSTPAIEVNASSTSSVEGKGSISTIDQPANKTASIKSVMFANPGWVVIREERDGAPGNILGAQWFISGTYDDQFVELLRPMIAGGTYYAALYNDDGDKLFNYKKDTPLADDQGNVIMQKFMAK